MIDRGTEAERDHVRHLVCLRAANSLRGGHGVGGGSRSRLRGRGRRGLRVTERVRRRFALRRRRRGRRSLVLRPSVGRQRRQKEHRDGRPERHGAFHSVAPNVKQYVCVRLVGVGDAITLARRNRRRFPRGADENIALVYRQVEQSQGPLSVGSRPPSRRVVSLAGRAAVC
jgi:hypothetical protein